MNEEQRADLEAEKIKEIGAEFFEGAEEVEVRRPLAMAAEEGHFAGEPMKLERGKYGPLTNRYVPRE